VVIYRIPRGQSLLSPGSHCPSCGHPLGALDNIPLVSFFFLGGRCRYCRAPISIRYPLVETLTGVLFGLAFAEFGLTLQAGVVCASGALLIAVAFIDLDHLLVLDWSVVALGAVGVVRAVSEHNTLAALEGAALGAGIFGAVFLATRGAGIGLGDVKLGAALGLLFGYPLALGVAVAAFVIGAVLALPVLAAGARGRRDALPFGPFLVVASIIALYAPRMIIGPYEAYRSLLQAYWTRG
jgi:leader peptidase (prepilin peptidase)/N-methyltransferase